MKSTYHFQLIIIKNDLIQLLSQSQSNHNVVIKNSITVEPPYAIDLITSQNGIIHVDQIQVEKGHLSKVALNYHNHLIVSQQAKSLLDNVLVVNQSRQISMPGIFSIIQVPQLVHETTCFNRRIKAPGSDLAIYITDERNVQILFSLIRSSKRIHDVRIQLIQFSVNYFICLVC